MDGWASVPPKTLEIDTLSLLRNLYLPGKLRLLYSQPLFQFGQGARTKVPSLEVGQARDAYLFNDSEKEEKGKGGGIES